MREKILAIVMVVIGFLALINLVVLDIAWLKNFQKEKVTPPSEPLLPSVLPSPTLAIKTGQTTDACGPFCQGFISQKISEAIATLSGKMPVSKTTVSKETPQILSQPGVTYIPLGGSSSTTSREWADVVSAQVFLDIDDYANLDKIYFEGFLKVKHGNGKAFARLYDVTHGISVQGSEISTETEGYTLVESGSLSLWRGKNLYRVQIKSLSGYEAYFDTGRIKCIIK